MNQRKRKFEEDAEAIGLGVAEKFKDPYSLVNDFKLQQEVVNPNDFDSIRNTVSYRYKSNTFETESKPVSEAFETSGNVDQECSSTSTNSTNRQIHSLDSLRSIVSHQERTISDGDIKNAFGIPLPDLLPRIFNHSIHVNENKAISVEQLLRSHGSSNPWLIDLINKLLTMEGRFIYTLLTQNILRKENLILQQQISQLKSVHQKMNGEIAHERRKSEFLFRKNELLSKEIDQAWKGLQIQAKMEDSNKLYKSAGVNVECFDLIRDQMISVINPGSKNSDISDISVPNLDRIPSCERIEDSSETTSLAIDIDCQVSPKQKNERSYHLSNGFDLQQNRNHSETIGSNKKRCNSHYKNEKVLFENSYALKTNAKAPKNLKSLYVQ